VVVVVVYMAKDETDNQKTRFVASSVDWYERLDALFTTCQPCA